MTLHYFAVITTKKVLEGLGTCSSREVNKLKIKYGDTLQLIPKEQYDEFKKLIKRPQAFRKYRVERCDLTQMV